MKGVYGLCSNCVTPPPTLRPTPSCLLSLPHERPALSELAPVIPPISVPSAALLSASLPCVLPFFLPFLLRASPGGSPTPSSQTWRRTDCLAPGTTAQSASWNCLREGPPSLRGRAPEITFPLFGSPRPRPQDRRTPRPRTGAAAPCPCRSARRPLAPRPHTAHRTRRAESGETCRRPLHKVSFGIRVQGRELKGVGNIAKVLTQSVPFSFLCS